MLKIKDQCEDIDVVSLRERDGDVIVEINSGSRIYLYPNGKVLVSPESGPDTNGKWK